MGGFFGVSATDDCVLDLYYGTDYHCHLGTRRGGLTVSGNGHFRRFIHNIETTQFRSKFEADISALHGTRGIGVISDFEDQPLIVGSHLGTFAIATVGRINNVDELTRELYADRGGHFAEMSGGEINPTELVAALISRGASFVEGIRYAQERIRGSCSMLLLTADGVFAARDLLGRTPIVIGRKDGATAATLETCAFANLGYEIDTYLGPGEIVRLTPDGVEQLQAPGDAMQICTFLWVYYGYPASHYEGINVEAVRNRCGEKLADGEGNEVDTVAGIPDSGTAHALGFANRSGKPYGRPFVKYTPTWPRSFMPQDQRVRDLVARMKLIPIPELIEGRRLLFCEDSIVRGTQLRDTIQRLYDLGAREIHMRPACPPLVFGCTHLNFSRSKSEMDLAARRAIRAVTGEEQPDLDTLRGFADPDSEGHAAMIDHIRKRLNLTTLRYQRLDDLVEAVGLPEEKLCTDCWTGRGLCGGCPSACGAGRERA